MTVSSIVNRVDYTGTGTLTYAYPFKVFAAADLEVYVDNVLMTLTTDYSVTGAGAVGGGNVVFVASVNGKAVSFIRNLAPTQLTDYVAHDSFPAETHEAALDKLTMLIQQLIDARPVTLAVVNNFTASISTRYYVTTAASVITATLPTAVGKNGESVFIKKIDSGVGSVHVVGTIDGAADYDLTNQNQYLEVTSDGTNWQITNNN